VFCCATIWATKLRDILFVRAPNSLLLEVTCPFLTQSGHSLRGTS
jgi:hypothetical protein